MNDFIVDFLVIVSIGFCVPFVISLILAPFYFKFGFGKKFYHDVLNWHRPIETEENTFDGLSVHNHCKFCGEEIMQDSQGNWF